MLKDTGNEQILNFAFIGKCVKGLAHNINTPLSAIMGRSEMLQMRLGKVIDSLSGSAESEALGKCLRDASLILENSSRVAGIIKNAMNKSIHAENSSLQTLNLGALLNEELTFLAADMEYKHALEKEFDISTTVPPLEGEYCHFSNTFIELIQNAQAAMTECNVKKLFVSLQHGSGCIDIIVGDSGCGFDMEKLPAILQMLNSAGEQNADDVPEGGLRRSVGWLKPYKPFWRITSRPGDTTVHIQIPL